MAPDNPLQLLPKSGSLEGKSSFPDFSAVLSHRREHARRDIDSIGLGDRFVWEIGCGHGHFLTAYAAGHPQKICIGIDVAGERVERAKKKRDRAKLQNLHFLRIEARLFLEALPPGARFSDLFLLFPDPWPKARHHKHRILQPDFLVAAAACAKSGARLHFRTDYRPYFDEAHRVVNTSAHWEHIDAPWPFEFETVFQQRADHYDSIVAQLR